MPVNFGNLRHPKRDMIWVAGAGPAANFVMALGWAFLLRGHGTGGTVAERRAAANGGIWDHRQPGLDGIEPASDSAAGWRAHRGGIAARARGVWLSRVEPYGFFVILALLIDPRRAWDDPGTDLQGVRILVIRSLSGHLTIAGRSGIKRQFHQCSLTACCRACVPTGPHAHRPLPWRAQELGAPAGGVRVPVLRRGLARAHHALRIAGGHLGDDVGNDGRLARGGPRSRALDAVHPVAGDGARRARAAARHDDADRLARARADVQGPAAEARPTRTCRRTASWAIR